MLLALSDNWSWKPIVVFFLCGRLKQVLLYCFLKGCNIYVAAYFWNLVLIVQAVNEGSVEPAKSHSLSRAFTAHI